MVAEGINYHTVLCGKPWIRAEEKIPFDDLATVDCYLGSFTCFIQPSA